MTCRSSHWLDGLRELADREAHYRNVSLHVAFRVLENRGLSLGQEDLKELREAVTEWTAKHPMEKTKNG